MGHGFESSDNMFTVRQPTWHGLGVVLPDYPTREEAKAIAHPWEPIYVPTYRVVVDSSSGVTEYVEREDLAAIRDDNNADLGTVTSTFSGVSNETLYDIADALQGESSQVLYETGGSLEGGRRVWLLLRLNEPIEIKGDPHGTSLPYYALQNNHVGQGSLRGQGLVTRIQCANTSQLADLESRQRGTELVFRHTKNIDARIEDAKMALAGWRNDIEEWKAVNEHLFDLKVDLDGRKRFLEMFVPEPPALIVSDRVRDNIKHQRKLIEEILNSETCEGIEHTALGLVNAAIEYGQHVRRAHNSETRFKRAVLDRSRQTAVASRLAKLVAV